VKQIAETRSRFAAWCLTGVLVLLVAVFAAPLAADSKAETLRPANDAGAPRSPAETELRKQLEAEYRAELEKRVAQEKAGMEGSLRSLWFSNAAVWTVLAAFIVFQALGAHKRAAELQRLRDAREGKGG
jgi:hypothetical protein